MSGSFSGLWQGADADDACPCGLVRPMAAAVGLADAHGAYLSESEKGS